MTKIQKAIKKKYYTYYHFLKQIRSNSIIILAIMLLPIVVLKAQVGGQTIVQNFSPKEYKAETQNWDIIQDKRGVMYFANSGGILEFDGNNWRTISPKYGKLVRSLAIDTDGVIYVGGFGDFGVLTPGPTGLLEYISLLTDKQRKDFNLKDVWKILATKNGVYFTTSSKLIKWENGKIKIIKAPNRFHRFYHINDRIYGRDTKKGVFYIENDIIKFVKGGEQFSDEKIYMMQPYDENRILIGTISKGFFLFTPAKNDAPASFEKFKTEADDFLLKNNLYQGLKIDETHFLLGTGRDGALIIDKKGKKKGHLNKETNLIDDNVHALYKDSQSGLWIVYNNGISRVEFTLPIKTWANDEQLKGTIYSLLKDDGKLYIGTSTGLYTLSEKQELSHISLGRNAKAQTWMILKVVRKSGKSSLIISQNGGVYELDKKKITLINPAKVCYISAQSKANPNRVYLGRNTKITVIEYINGKWETIGDIEGKENYTIRNIEETANGNLWISTNNKGVLHVEIENNDIKKYKITTYNKKQGLKTLDDISMFFYKKNRFFSSDSGVYLLDTVSQKFILDARFDKILQPKQRFRETLVTKNKVWAERTFGNSIAEVGYFYEDQNNDFIWKDTPLLRYPQSVTHSIYLDENNTLWTGGSEGLLQYEIKKKFAINTSFNSLIREVSVPHLGKIFRGSYLGKTKIVGEKKGINLVSSQQNKNAIPILKYKNNAIRFKYAAPSFDNTKANLFSYKLSGFDEEWSDWSNDFKKEYTNLPEREYIFRVKAKNIYNVVSSETTYSFVILPPWYRTPFAFLGFTSCFLLLIWIMITLNTQRLKKDNKRLEEKVNARTSEIAAQNTLLLKQKNEISSKKDELEENYDKLEDVLDELRLKNKEIFFQKQLVQDQTDKLTKAQKVIKGQNKKLQKTNTSLEKEVYQRAKELEVTYQNLLEVKNELDLYIYRSAHDLKAPITRLLGLVNVAQLELKNDSLNPSEYFEKLRNVGNEMTLMQTNLVLVHTINSQELKKESIDWESLIFEQLSDLSKIYDLKKITITTEITANISILSDAFLLRTLFKKLLVNAIKFRNKESEKSIIKIAVSQTKNTTYLSFKDNGVGIDKKITAKIFDMFSVYNEQSTGSGLGLYIAKNISKKLKGKLRLNTQNTSETEFIFSFPHR